MANDSGWWKLKTTVKPNQIDLDHIAEMVKQGYTSGEIVEEDKPELVKNAQIPKETMDEHNEGQVTAVANYLSDKYGFCVSSLDVKLNEDGSGTAYNIVWDTSE